MGDLRLAKLNCICLLAAVGCAAGDRDQDPEAIRPHASPSAAAQRSSAILDRAGLTAEGHPEISWRTSDLHAKGASAEVALPSSADAPFHVKDQRSSARIAVRMLEARRADAEVVDGRVVYPRGHARGDVIHQVRESGTEDFVILREGGTSFIDYELEIEQGVAGLRLGADTLEMLDAGGAPRLRVPSPYVIDDTGRRIAASLSLDGCAYDTSPAAPWGRPVTPPGAGSCRVHVAWSDAGLRYPLIVDPAWLTTNNLRRGRDGHAATVLANGLVLFSGGEAWSQNGAVCTGGSELSAELFDPATVTFALTGSTKYGHWHHRSVTLTNGQALISGTELGGSFSSMELYDPVAGTWSYVSSPEGERAHPALARLPGGAAMLFGGANTLGTVMKTTMVYTFGTGWAPGAPMASARINHDAVLLDDNSILIVGGTDQAGADVPTSERYVPGVGWETPVNLALSAGQTYRSTARLGSGRFLVAYPSASQIYDPSMKQWSSIASTTVYTPKSASLGNGQVLVLGSISSSNATANAQRYNEASGWIAETTPTVARYPTGDSLTALSTGDVLVAGGIPLSGCATTNDAEVYKFCPPFTVTPASLPAANAAAPYSQSLGSSGATGAVTYAVTSGSLPNGLTLSSDGTLSGTPSVGGNFSFTVKATDANACTGSRAYSFTVTCPAISLSPTSLPFGRGGSLYDQMISSTVGIGAVTYAVSSGALPPGVTLASGGTLSGTPTAAGNFNFTVTGTDTASCTGSQAYSLPIYCPSFVFSPSSPLPDGIAGTPYTPAMIVAGGALGATTYQVGSGAGTPPPGMTLASDGTLSGTPTQSGTFDWIVSATDSSFCMHSALFDLSIAPNAVADDAGSADTGSPDADFDAGIGAGTDAALLDDGARAADAAIVESGAEAAVVDAATDRTTVDARGQSATDAGADAVVDAPSATAETSIAPDSGLESSSVTDATAPLGESGSPDRRDAATGGTTTAEASPESAAASNDGGCACRQSRRAGPSWLLFGLAFLVLAARCRRSSARQLS
jgi:hypothetical protein